jgi:hypothetical protein
VKSGSPSGGVTVTEKRALPEASAVAITLVTKLWPCSCPTA